MAQLLTADPAALDSIIAFRGLSSTVLAWLLQAGELCQYADGETVVLAGAPADKLIAVVRGGTHTQLPGDPSARGFQLKAPGARVACCRIPGFSSFRRRA